MFGPTKYPSLVQLPPGFRQPPLLFSQSPLGGAPGVGMQQAMNMPNVSGMGMGMNNPYQKPTPVMPDYTSGTMTPGAVTPGADPVQPGQMISTSAIDRAANGGAGSMPGLGSDTSGSFGSWWQGLFSGGGGAGTGGDAVASAGGDAGGGAAGGGGAAAAALPAAYAAAIGFGKNTEANHPNTPVGDTSLALLGPDFNQVMQDPVGMGLPTLFGLPFLTPFTASQSAKAAKPEWSSLFPMGA